MIDVENDSLGPATPGGDTSNLQEATPAPAPAQPLSPVEHTTQFHEPGPSTNTATTSTSTLPLPPPIKKKKRRRRKKLLEQQGKIKKGRRFITHTGIRESFKPYDVVEKLPQTECNILPITGTLSSQTPMKMLPVKTADVVQMRTTEFYRQKAANATKVTNLANKDTVSNAASNIETSVSQAKLLDEASTSRLVVHDQSLLKKEKSQPSPQYSRFDFLANSIIITDVTTDKGTITIKECSAYEAFFGPEPNRPE